MYTESTEMYLQAIYRLTEKSPQVSIGAIARAMGFSLSTVSEKVKRLAGEGLLRHEWREQVALTEQGRTAALKTLRKRRLIESFLYWFARYGIDELYPEACRLEHIISDRLADELERMLGYPYHDPHGHPIPSMDGHLETQGLPSLVEIDEGREVMVSQLHTADPDILKYAFSIGLIPGSLCRVLKRAPLEGPVTVNLGEETVAVSYALSEIVEVQEIRVSMAGEG